MMAFNIGMNCATQAVRALAGSIVFSIIATAPVNAQNSQPASDPAAQASEPRFNVDAEGAPARAFFMGLVDGTPHSMLVHPQVSGSVSIHLKQVTMEQALEGVRDLYGYDYRRVSTGFMVLPATLQTRIFQVNYLDVQRQGESKTRVSSGQVSQSGYSGGASNGARPSGGQESSEVTGTAVSTRNDSDFWKSIEKDLGSIIAADGKNRSVVINRQSGLIVVRAMPSELRDVGDYLQRVESTVTRQVVLEAKVIEVELNDAYQAGINWTAVFSDGGKQYTLGQGAPNGGFDRNQLLPPSTNPVTVAPGNPINGFVRNALGGAFTVAADFTDFNVFIELLGLQGRTRVLSSPRVATLHNQKAIIKAGTDEFFVTGVHSDTTTGTSTTTTVEYELTPFFSGVALDVTPQISGDGHVLLHIHPTISDVRDQQKVLTVRGLVDTLPLALSQVRESDSVVQARSGQVIVIGGLMREQRRHDTYKTPLLGDVPVLGKLFRSERDHTQTTELVILLRPLVVSDGDWPQLVQEPTRRLNEMIEKARLK